MSDSTDVTDAPIAARARIADWLHGQLRNIAPFATLLVLVVFFSAGQRLLRHARQPAEHPDADLGDRHHRGRASPS